MSYRIAGIDVHKKMLAVVVADAEVDGEYQFERRQFGRTPTSCEKVSWPWNFLAPSAVRSPY
jgi:hypothetical protein